MQAKPAHKEDALIDSLQLTEAEKHIALQLDARNYVQEVLQWSDARYERFMLKTCIQWCEHHTNYDAKLIAAMMRSEAFKRWFCNAFANRDIEFMIEMCYGEAQHPPLNSYVMLHDAKRLANKIFPGRNVWREIHGGKL